MVQKKYIYILISVLALSYCLFKPVQLRLLTLYAPGCIPFETKAYFREVPLTKRYWWTRNQSLDKWPFYYKHSSIVSVFLLLGNKYFIIQNSGWNANFSSPFYQWFPPATPQKCNSMVSMTPLLQYLYYFFLLSCPQINYCGVKRKRSNFLFLNDLDPQNPEPDKMYTVISVTICMSHSNYSLLFYFHDLSLTSSHALLLPMPFFYFFFLIPPLKFPLLVMSSFNSAFSAVSQRWNKSKRGTTSVFTPAFADFKNWSEPWTYELNLFSKYYPYGNCFSST